MLAALVLPVALLAGTGSVEPADGEATFRTLFGGPAGPVQHVPRRSLPDAFDTGDIEAAATLRDDAIAGAGEVPVTRTSVGTGAARRDFVLAGDVLVVAATGPDYRLLDALSVRTDPGGYPSIHAGLALGGDVPAVLVTNAHFNSQEGFAVHTLLALDGDSLARVWDGPLLYSLATGDDACDTRRVEQQLLRFEPRTAGGAAWPAIDVAFRETESCEKDGTTAPSRPRDFTATLRFDAASRRYIGSFAELDALNRKRLGFEEE